MANAIDWTALDYSNPAALLAILQPVYYALIAGDTSVEIEGHDRRRVKFQPANIQELRSIISDLQGQIAKAAGGPRKRYALMARSHGPGRNFGGSPY